jgi:hypothetical protein
MYKVQNIETVKRRVKQMRKVKNIMTNIFVFSCAVALCFVIYVVCSFYLNIGIDVAQGTVHYLNK